MKRKRVRKNRIKAIFLMLTLLIFIEYLCCVFIILDPDIFSWNSSDRAAFLAIAFFLSFFMLGIYAHDEQEAIEEEIKRIADEDELLKDYKSEFEKEYK